MLEGRLVWDEYLFRVKLSGLIREGGRILELGTGGNTTTLEMFGDQYTVIPSDKYVEPGWNAHFPGMMQIDAHSLTESDAGKERWEAVMLSEVLEHVEIPLVVLQKSRDVLKPGGVVIVTTPFNYRIHEYGPQDPEITEPGLKDYWRFCPDGLALLFEMAGFAEFWVGRVCREATPDWHPDGVVGWAKTNASGAAVAETSVRLDEFSWSPELPQDWREQHRALATQFERTLQNG